MQYIKDQNNIRNMENRENPFFVPYHTPHDTVPFNRIKLEDYEPAFMEGIRRDKEATDKVINDPAKPTFENTIARVDTEKGEHYYDLLSRVSNVFSCMMSAETCDEMEELAQKMSPILTKHANDITLNKKLFERIKYVHDHPNRELTPEEQMLLETSYDGFVRSGALLDEEGKDKLRKLTEEASILTLQFSQNLLKENKAFTLHITDEAQLDGLPETAKAAAAHAAKEKNEEGWIFTLDYPSYSPFMTYSTQRELRKQMFNDLIEAYKPTAEKEVKEVEALAKKLEGEDFKMEPWDFGFYSHKLQMEKYNLDAEMLRPYFQLDKVIKGVFGLANKLYGITFKENKNIPVYHPDVKAYEVFDKDGSYLAVFYADFFPRKGKQGGAWMTEFQGQWIDHKGNNIRPHVSVVMNFTKPTEEKPALLTLGEVETFLHEFGHSLHGMFANTRFESLSGTNVWWDFVELPSQFMENYAIEKEFLRTFAFHYETGEPLPDELIERIVKSRNFMAAYACLRQVSFGLLDMAYYTKKDVFTADIIPFEKEAWKEAMILPQLPDTCMTVQFSHIMAGGYAAGYYSYKWAEVLDADAFSVFKKNGIFDPTTAQSFRDNILSKGGTEHPMTLYKRFRGQEPTIDALLERNEIKKS